MKKYCMAMMLAVCVVGTLGGMDGDSASEKELAVLAVQFQKMLDMHTKSDEQLESECLQIVQRVIDEETCDFFAKTWRLQERAIKGDDRCFKQQCKKMKQKWSEFMDGSKISDKLAVEMQAAFGPEFSGTEIHSDALSGLEGLLDKILSSFSRNRAIYQRYVELYKGQGSDSGGYSDSGSGSESGEA